MSSMSLYSLGRIAVRNAAILIVLPLVAAATAGIWSRTQRPVWVAESRFTPNRSEDGAMRVAGLAAQLGIDVGAGSSGESLDFYQQLVHSRTLLREAASSKVRGQRGEASVVQLVGAKGETPAQRLSNAIDRLQDQVEALPDPRSNLLTVRVSLRDPVAAERLNRRILDLVNEFNLEKRRTSATVERSFVEARRREAQLQLQEAERELERFHAGNVRFEGSARLSLREAQLQRAVELRQEVFVSLAQAYEKARIDEVRNTPLITVLDGPEESARRSTGGLPQMILLGLVLGFVAAVSMVVVREVLDHQRRAFPEEYEQFRVAFRRVTLRAPRATVK